MITEKGYTELNEILKHQDVLKIPKIIYQYAKTEPSFFSLVCDVFNYGYILGIRAERSRRKKTTEQS